MSSGIYKRKIIIKKGDRFNNLTAVKFAEMRPKSHQYWFFECDCGIKKIINVNSVKRGTTKSCGCSQKGIINNYKHGMAKTKIYKIWSAMKERCYYKNAINYKYYGDRGITVCKQWLKFENFYKDMGNCPKNKTLDRINNNGNYCKENCRWANLKIQANNRRNNHFITYKGKTQTIAQWAKELNINSKTLYNRILTLNWSIDKAFRKI